MVLCKVHFYTIISSCQITSCEQIETVINYSFTHASELHNRRRFRIGCVRLLCDSHAFSMEMCYLNYAGGTSCRKLCHLNDEGVNACAGLTEKEWKEINIIRDENEADIRNP